MKNDAPNAALQAVPERITSFILDNTSLQSLEFVPELQLYLADEAHDLWHKTEKELANIGLPPPFWAFAWAGGQGLARYILDHPELVRGKIVLDFASGSGLVGIAAMKASAQSVICADIDVFAMPAMALNAAANGVDLSSISDNLIGQDHGWDVVLAGDVFYDKAFADLLMPWFRQLAKRGALVLMGDPGRAYLPKNNLAEQALYQVPVTRALEDADVKSTRIWCFADAALK
ncbi:class I SAM-dependent methyltransferase [Paenochrobactrum sp. BZR 588]|uniref:class I SAM-dependent methyltransferase n=1 Tax=unclassified Paenochrobactrum TaxID=2639760 RepID=UPI0038541F29